MKDVIFFLVERVKKLIGPQHFAELRAQAAKIEKVLNLKARNELKDITGKILENHNFRKTNIFLYFFYNLNEC